jgi:hypothetical protein
MLAVTPAFYMQQAKGFWGIQTIFALFKTALPEVFNTVRATS